MSKISKGFTLIELIIVTVVIGIISVIGVASFTKVQVLARDNERSSKSTVIITALEKYYSQNGEYPSCNSVSQSVEEAALIIDIDNTEIFKTPLSASNNAILPDCKPLINGSTEDNFAYIGIGDNCVASGCGSYIFEYIEEATGQIISTKSRYNIDGWMTITTGQYHNCALNYIGKVFCWGRNDSGEFGNSSLINSITPVQVYTGGALNGKTIASISAGYNHTCALDSDGIAYCWGYGNDGQLGNGLYTGSQVPVKVTMNAALNGLIIKSISAGYGHTCAIASNDKAYCWGLNSHGELGDGTTISKSAPTIVNGTGLLGGLTVNMISAGGYDTCAVNSGGAAYCWGYDNKGQLGDNATTQRTTPFLVNTGALNGKTVKKISAGYQHTCAIANTVTTANWAYCWGYNLKGQLGNTLILDSKVPVSAYQTIPSLTSFNTISASPSTDILGGHSCSITAGSVAFCWGNGGYGQIGSDLVTINTTVPVRVINDAGVLNGLSTKIVTTGQYHSCAIASNNKIYCWGRNTYGQLGTASIASSSFTLVPVAIDY